VVAFIPKKLAVAKQKVSKATRAEGILKPSFLSKAPKEPIISWSSGDSWVGGCLTNWKQVSKSVKSYASFFRRFDRFLVKNSIEFARYRKIKKKFQGFVSIRGPSTSLPEPERADPPLLRISTPVPNGRGSREGAASLPFRGGQRTPLGGRKKQLQSDTLKAIPDLIFIMDPASTESITILHEAARLNIPVIALADPSTPSLPLITYPIPINNHSTHEMFYYLNCFFFSKLRKGQKSGQRSSPL
jgi:hypothetical protein